MSLPAGLEVSKDSVAERVREAELLKTVMRVDDNDELASDPIQLV